MRITILILLLLNVKVSISQITYKDKMYDFSKKTYTYQKNKKKNLKLDFYKPKNHKGLSPLIVYVHGGGFSGGSRNSKSANRFANEMAKRGYSVASISYRLTMRKLGFSCKTNSRDKINAFNYASEDISLAVKYLIQYQKRFNIKKSQIILVGSSAGAEGVLNLVYVHTTKILPKNFKFAGIISMAGAVTTLRKITSKKAIPTQLFHGIEDKLVPFNIASHHYCAKKDVGYLKLYGSKALANKFKKINKPYYLYTVSNGNHSWSWRPMRQCIPEIVDFLYYDVLKSSKRQIETTI